MYAVIKTGGKQYKVAQDQVIRVEKIEGEAGTAVTFDQVLMVGEDGAAPTVGAPVVAGTTVTGEIVEQTRADKIIVFKKLRRQNHRRKKGHRQDLTAVRITGIGGKAKKKAAPKKKAAAKSTEKPAEAPAAEETAEAKE